MPVEDQLTNGENGRASRATGLPRLAQWSALVLLSTTAAGSAGGVLYVIVRYVILSGSGAAIAFALVYAIGGAVCGLLPGLFTGSSTDSSQSHDLTPCTPV